MWRNEYYYLDGTQLIQFEDEIVNYFIYMFSNQGLKKFILY